MIKIEKGDEPAVLARLGAKWTAAIQRAQAKGKDLTKYQKSCYRRPEIRAAIIAETRGKCAYCEEYLLHISFGDIEHVVPKSTDPQYWFKWENLTLACQICNNAKGDKLGFIDPHVDEPSDHLVFLGETVFPNPASDKGVKTCEIILNRPEIIQERRKKLEQIKKEVRLAVLETDLDVRASLVASLKKQMEPDRPYSAVVKAVLPKLLRVAGL